jgi:hypothetical protein
VEVAEIVWDRVMGQLGAEGGLKRS